MTERTIMPTPDEISLLWEKVRQDNPTVSLWVEAWIPDDHRDDGPRSADEWKVIRAGDDRTLGGFIAINGPVIGKGSRLAIQDKTRGALCALVEDIHPHWVYSIEVRESGE